MCPVVGRVFELLSVDAQDFVDVNVGALLVDLGVVGTESVERGAVHFLDPRTGADFVSYVIDTSFLSEAACQAIAIQNRKDNSLVRLHSVHLGTVSPLDTQADRLVRFEVVAVLGNHGLVDEGELESGRAVFVRYRSVLCYPISERSGGYVQDLIATMFRMFAIATAACTSGFNNKPDGYQADRDPNGMRPCPSIRPPFLPPNGYITQPRPCYDPQTPGKDGTPPSTPRAVWPQSFNERASYPEQLLNCTPARYGTG